MANKQDKPNAMKPEVVQKLSPDTGKSIYAPDHTSEVWNNDISMEEINQIPDLDLTTEDTLTIRKAFDLGTEEIAMQTIISIDGDVTTRIAREFATSPNQTVLNLHNEAINISIKFWDNLINTIMSIAGQTFKAILGK